jgi:dUTPase-like protein
MNVNDVSDDAIPTPVPERDRLDLIFERQRRLMIKYHDIEQANGLLETPDIPVNMHDRFGQARLKSFAWRVTEEIGEATAARIDHPGIPEHFLEELSDAFHFLVELCILSGHTSSTLYGGLAKEFQFESETFGSICKLEEGFRQIDVGSDDVRWYAYNVIEHLTRAMNCLKQKPWKQTHILTDVGQYNTHLMQSFLGFLALCQAGGLEADGLFRIYFRKSEVNRFRQRSRY